MPFDPDDELEGRLAPLPPLAKTALAAASAERVNPVYENYFDGEHVAAVREAIDFGWECCAGAVPDPARAKRLEDHVRDHVEYWHEESVTILGESASVSLRVLETLPTMKEADPTLGVVRAFGASVFVAQMAAELSGTFDEDAAEEEEVEWQEKAIALAFQHQGPFDAAMFRALAPHPPRWYDAYVAGPEHL